MKGSLRSHEERLAPYMKTDCVGYEELAAQAGGIDRRNRQAELASEEAAGECG